MDAQSFMTIVTTGAFLDTTPVPTNNNEPDPGFFFTTIAPGNEEFTTGSLFTDLPAGVIETTAESFEEWTSPEPSFETTQASILETLPVTDDDPIFDFITTASVEIKEPSKDDKVPIVTTPETTKPVTTTSTEKVIVTTTPIKTTENITTTSLTTSTTSTEAEIITLAENNDTDITDTTLVYDETSVKEETDSFITVLLKIYLKKVNFSTKNTFFQAKFFIIDENIDITEDVDFLGTTADTQNLSQTTTAKLKKIVQIIYCLLNS